MKTITSKQFDRVVRLEINLHDLQSKIYDLSSEIEQIHKNIGETIGASGFELDEAINKMRAAINMIIELKS